jgi:hypothetical protein
MMLYKILPSFIAYISNHVLEAIVILGSKGFSKYENLSSVHTFLVTVSNHVLNKTTAMQENRYFISTQWMTHGEQEHGEISPQLQYWNTIPILHGVCCSLP